MRKKMNKAYPLFLIYSLITIFVALKSDYSQARKPAVEPELYIDISKYDLPNDERKVEGREIPKTQHSRELAIPTMKSVDRFYQQNTEGSEHSIGFFVSLFTLLSLPFIIWFLLMNHIESTPQNVTNINESKNDDKDDDFKIAS